MKPVLIQSIMKRRRRVQVRPDPVDKDIRKERDRLFAFILICLAVIVVGTIAIAA